MASATQAALKPIQTWHPDHFHTRHRMVCRLHAAGLKNKEIAEALGYTQSRVSIILNDPRAAEYIAEFAKEVGETIREHLQERIELAAPKAFEVAFQIMEDEDVHPGIRSKNAFDILDRAGYSKVEKHMQLPPPIADSVADRLEKSLGESRAIDAEYTIVDEDE